MRWYPQAAEAGSPRAQYNLGWCCEHGKGVARDLSRARELYQAAARQEYEGAQEALDRVSGKKSGFLRGLLGHKDK